MSKKFTILGLVTSFLILAVLSQTVLAAPTRSLLYASTCDTPIPYKIGTIDSRFKITETELREDIEKASNIWGGVVSKKLFEYDPNARMVVTLEYDRRQSLNSEINELDTELKEKNSQIEPKIAEFKSRSDAFEKNVAALNAEIKSWNEKGGAPEEEFQKLKSRQAALQQEAEVLNAMAKELNQTTSQYNTGVRELNQTVKDFNDALEDKPEEGLYTEEGLDREIVIYFNNTQQEMIHTLAHELGHALGLDHNQNTDSIMYPKANDVIIPTVEDSESLKVACAEQSRFKLMARNGIYHVYDIVRKIKN